MSKFLKYPGFVFSILILLSATSTTTLKRFYITGPAQGTSYHITYYAHAELLKRDVVDSLLESVNNSLSLYKEGSLVNQWNSSKNGGKIDIHLQRVLHSALDISGKTEGYFDITVLPLTSAWGFAPKGVTLLPDSNNIAAVLPCVGSNLLRLRKNKLHKKKACVQLDTNGIAQGYTVDLLAEMLEMRGIKDYLVELGGEIRIKGKKYPTAEKMSIGIEAPSDDPLHPVLQRLIYPDSGGITTSGNYRRFRETAEGRISHLFDPHTGYPVKNELISVTVVAADAMTADALDNALMGMGLQRGMELVEADTTLAAFFIYQNADGSVADSMSSRFKRLSIR
jgi:thiamine biosynthesis lipoprotein